MPQRGLKPDQLKYLNSPVTSNGFGPIGRVSDSSDVDQSLKKKLDEDSDLTAEDFRSSQPRIRKVEE